MIHIKSVLVLCVIVCRIKGTPLNMVVNATEMVFEDVNDAVEVGPPDSHEAMNNRDVHPRIRRQPSYEFLMGLINNNSKYEVVRRNPPRASTVRKDSGVNELLLQLMLKIAQEPDQWNNVHRILHEIENDLDTSKNIVEKLENRSNFPRVSYQHKDHEKNTVSSTEEILTSETEKTWPVFNETVNNGSTEENNNKTAFGEIGKARKQFLKNFSYHRVTVSPIFRKKSPTAYVAVSAVSPQSDAAKNDVLLEHELEGLKPRIENLRLPWWPH